MTATTLRRLIRAIGLLATSVLLLAVLGCGAGGSPDERGTKPIFNGLLLPLVPESEKFIRYEPVEFFGAHCPRSIPNTPLWPGTPATICTMTHT